MDLGRALRVETADGRTLVGAGFGPVTGRPILFIAGAATSSRMAFGLDLLETVGVRLLTMDRAGLGGSMPDDHRSLASTASDYRAFIEGVLGEEASEIPVVANSQGSVFGLMLATGGRVQSLTLVSPADEVAHPETRRMIPAEARTLADLARSNPEEAAEILGGFSAQAMEEMVLAGSSDADAAFYRSPSFREVYRRALDEGFANHGAGYVRDTLIALRPWGIDFQLISCPVQILFGIHDVTHSPDHGATLAGRIPGASRTVLDDAGGALLWTHAQLVFETALGREHGPEQGSQGRAFSPRPHPSAG
ncbi:alpha/beta fold hydrolase [Agromyces sp. NPDC055520]